MTYLPRIVRRNADPRDISRYGQRSAAFSPASVSGLVLDLDGDLGLTTSNVNRLYDKTPNAHTATQDTSGSRPSLIENDSDFNGHNSLSFDGAGDVMSPAATTDFNADSGLTIYAVAKIPAHGSTAYLFSYRDVNAQYQLQVPASGNATLFVRNAADTGWYLNTIGSGITGGTQTIRARIDPSVESGLRVDGGTESTVATPDLLLTPTSILNIPAFNTAGTTSSMGGTIARILIYKESIADGSTADLAIMAELDALYKGVGTPTGMLFERHGNLVADFDPDTGAGLATTAWADQSGGTAHDAAQATANKQPSLLAGDSTFNGHGSVSFDGVNDVLVIPDNTDLHVNGGMTIYVVGSMEAVSGAATLISNQLGAMPNREFQFRVISGGNKPQLLMRDSTDTAWLTTTGAVAVVGVGAVVARVRYDGTVQGVRTDTSVETTNVSTSWNSASHAGTGIGGTTVNTLYNAMTAVRILWYGRSVSAAEDVKIMAYLNARYHIGYSGFSSGFDSGFGG